MSSLPKSPIRIFYFPLQPFFYSASHLFLTELFNFSISVSKVSFEKYIKSYNISSIIILKALILQLKTFVNKRGRLLSPHVASEAEASLEHLGVAVH
jgi:hypothetical protein